MSKKAVFSALGVCESVTDAMCGAKYHQQGAWNLMSRLSRTNNDRVGRNWGHLTLLAAGCVFNNNGKPNKKCHVHWKNDVSVCGGVLLSGK